MVNEDWHAICQAIYKVVEGEEWGTLCCKVRGHGQSCQFSPTKHQSKANGDEYSDEDSEQKTQIRVAVRQALWG